MGNIASARYLLSPSVSADSDDSLYSKLNPVKFFQTRTYVEGMHQDPKALRSSDPKV
jgi:hypothetical protein